MFYCGLISTLEFIMVVPECSSTLFPLMVMFAPFMMTSPTGFVVVTLFPIFKAEEFT